MSPITFLKKHRLFVIGVLALTAWTIFLASIGGQRIVDIIGLNNGYLAVFVFALFGGVSALTAGSFYATTIALAVGGLHPLGLALCAVPGLVIGDYIFYLISKEGRLLINDLTARHLDRFVNRLDRWPDWAVVVASYLYTGFTPLPGDVLMATLAILGYRFRSVVVGVALGHFTFILAITTIGRYGLDSLLSYFS